MTTAAFPAPEVSKRVLRAVEETLRTFARAFRATQLYMPNNPMRPKAIEDAKTAFRELWPIAGNISFTIAESAFVIDGHEVYTDEDRGASGLPWLLYRDGLRRLDLSPGFEEQELETILDVFQRSRTAPADEDDIVTLLWIANLRHVQFRNVEVMNDFDAMYADEDAMDADADIDDLPPMSQLLEAALPGDGPPPALVRIEEFESSLTFLDSSEVAYLKKELRLDYEDDGLPKVIETLFDILENATATAIQREACDIIDGLVLDALAHTQYVVAAIALREARITLERCTHLDPAVSADLARLPVRLSEPVVIAQLLDVLDSPDGLLLAPFLEDLLLELRPRAVPSLLSWYGRATPSPVRHAVERSLVHIGNRHIAELARMIEHTDPPVVRGAVLVARVIASPALVTPLANTMATGDLLMRTNVVGALAAIGSPGALQQLERALDDSARDVRVSALRALGARKHMPLLGRLQRELQNKAIRAADLSEQMAFFETLGALSGDSAVPALDKILNGKGLFKFKETAEMRACAAHALGVIGSPAAHSALQRAANSTELIVRSAVTRAAKGAA